MKLIVVLLLFLSACATTEKQIIQLDFFTCVVRWQANGVLVLECGANDLWNKWNSEHEPHPSKGDARES